MLIGVDLDGVIDWILVIVGDRKKVELDIILDFFILVIGKWKMKNLGKIYVDDESYNLGYGYVYEVYGVDVFKGVIVVVWFDYCEYFFFVCVWSFEWMLMIIEIRCC